MNIAKKTLTICAIIVVFSAALYFLFLSRSIILLLLIAIFLVIAINPFVKQIKRRGIPTLWATLIADFLLIVILCGILAIIAKPLLLQCISLFQMLPHLTQSLASNSTVNAFIQKYNLTNSLNQISSNLSTIVLGGSASLLFIATNLLDALTSIVIVLVLTFLLQIEGETIWLSALSFLPEIHAETARRIGGRIMHDISGFVSGNLFISLIAGIVTLITLWILNVPYLFALAALVALFDLIPLIGAAIATIAVGLVALSKGVIIAAIAVAILLLYQFIEGHVIQPIVYSRSINLSALLIVVASLLGAELNGIVGVLLAIPVAAIIQILIVELYAVFKKSRSVE